MFYLQMLDPVPNQGFRLCLGAFRTSIKSLKHTNLAKRAKLPLQYASKIKSLPKHPTHDTVFENKYMKLFDVRPNAIRTFGIRIKQFLTAFNIDFFRHFENTFIFFVLPPWYINPPKIVLDLVDLKKERTDHSVYKQLFVEI